MSTRSTTNFGDGPPRAGDANEPESKVYRHSDGYPEWMLSDLVKFFETVEEETDDPRYMDPSYLAAKWVVFLARIFSTPYEGPEYEANPDSPKVGSLDFLSVGVVRKNPGDIDYSYWLDCFDLDPTTKRPVVYISTGIKSGVVGGWVRVDLPETGEHK